jgi:16S rRNA (uracil1498-N3)-methyltransferase
MPRIFCNSPLIIQDRYELPLESSRHIQVLRLQPGMQITLFNGRGGEFQAEILEMTRKEVYVKVISFEGVERELQRPVHLAIGIPANERMDWLIEKATELGLTRLTPLMTQHNVVRINPERSDKKTHHWNAIASAACAQCGRNRAPLIDTSTNLTSWLQSLPEILENDTSRWFFSLNQDSESFFDHFSQYQKQSALAQTSLVIAFGPEGGWSTQEELLLKNHHFTALSLGSRVLRTETAAIATLSTLSLLM